MLGGTEAALSRIVSITLEAGRLHIPSQHFHLHPGIGSSLLSSCWGLGGLMRASASPPACSGFLYKPGHGCGGKGDGAPPSRLLTLSAGPSMARDEPFYQQFSTKPLASLLSWARGTSPGFSIYPKLGRLVFLTLVKNSSKSTGAFKAKFGESKPSLSPCYSEALFQAHHPY